MFNVSVFMQIVMLSGLLLHYKNEKKKEMNEHQRENKEEFSNF